MLWTIYREQEIKGQAPLVRMQTVTVVGDEEGENNHQSTAKLMSHSE